MLVIVMVFVGLFMRVIMSVAMVVITPMPGFVPVIVPRLRLMRMLVRMVMPAPAHTLFQSLRSRARGLFAGFQTLFFGMANVTHSGFLGRFVV
ncbi:hypothetical protein [Paraburkholderia sp. GAS333]|uniref:hypothetical protein n=1 Tax=Paraburkholderia sp. GAS333 TaxID=3156279 RepID=UPI003D193F6B